LILGIDPGYGCTGYGFIEKTNDGNRFRPFSYGVIQTDKALPFPQRLLSLFDEIENLIQKNRPKLIVIEKFYFGKNINTGLKTAESRGVIQLCAAKMDIPVKEISPKEVKKGICGTGNAKKGEIQRMLTILLQLDEIPRPDDAADALAVAISGADYL
jgi:crossover junction endodeoxyribonuclease RuvC